MKLRQKVSDVPSRGRANLARLRAMTDEEVMRTSPPELANLPDDFWDSAVLVPPIPKQAISLRVDDDVLTWFRKQGPGYQSRINAILRTYMERMRLAKKPMRRKNKARG